MRLSIPLFFLLVLFAFANCFSQSTRADASDLSFEMPTGWFEIGADERIANLKKYEFSREQLSRLLANEKKSEVIAVFYRDDPKTTPGIIPTIQITLRPKPRNMPFERFKNDLTNVDALGKMLDDFSLIGEVQSAEVSGIRSVLFEARFTLGHHAQKYTVKARTYAIPRDDHFIQISMSGEDNEDWTEQEFAKFIESFKLN